MNHAIEISDLPLLEDIARLAYDAREHLPADHLIQLHEMMQELSPHVLKYVMAS